MITRGRIGPRMSQVVKHSGVTVYVSGQVADDAKGSIQEQTKQVLAKVETLLREASTTRSNLRNSSTVRGTSGRRNFSAKF